MHSCIVEVLSSPPTASIHWGISLAASGARRSTSRAHGVVFLDAAHLENGPALPRME